MNTNIERKTEITLDEYKAWLTGLLRGKGKALPNLADWNAINDMANKIVPIIVEVQNPMTPSVSIPFTPVTNSPAPWHNAQAPCGTAGQDGDNITIAEGTTNIAISNSIDDCISIGYTDSEGIAADCVTIGNITGGPYGGYGAPASLSNITCTYTGNPEPISILADLSGVQLAEMAKQLGIKE